jgi:subtilisin-like proprotein convertase family protein
MVRLGRNWTNVDSQIKTSVISSSVTGFAQHDIPFSTTFTVSNLATTIQSLEHVVVEISLTLREYGTPYSYSDYIDALYHYYDDDNGNTDYPDTEDRDIYDWLGESHPKRGDISIELTSPQGTKSILLPYRKYDFINTEGYTNWEFMTVHCWEENPIGSWKLDILFKSSSGYVDITVSKFELYGISSQLPSSSAVSSVLHAPSSSAPSSSAPSSSAPSFSAPSVSGAPSSSAPSVSGAPSPIPSPSVPFSITSSYMYEQSPSNQPISSEVVIEIVAPISSVIVIGFALFVIVAAVVGVYCYKKKKSSARHVQYSRMEMETAVPV